MNDLRRLKTEDKIAVIGGGPAGSFFAMYLLRMAAQNNIYPRVTIFHERIFNDSGPKGCKGCAGLLSISLSSNFQELGLTVPEEVIQSRVDQYAVHSPFSSIILRKSESEPQILAVFRGGGPATSFKNNINSFDEWLLGQAQRNGSFMETAKISSIVAGQNPRITIDGKDREFDIIVLATGLNSKQVNIQGVDYIPPKTHFLTQSELYADEAQVKACLGNTAHAFLIPNSNLIFGTLVPKGAYITASILSHSNKPASITDFLSHKIVRERLPNNYSSVCHCRPRTLIAPARHFYADGFVAIGDAAVSRLYKDGIGSSLTAARTVADTIVNHGFSKYHFKKYYQPYCTKIAADNRWGRIIFAILDRTKNSRIFMLSQHRIIGDEQRLDSRQRRFSKAGWGLFTGNYLYRNIGTMVIQPRALIRFGNSLLMETFSNVFKKDIEHRSIHVTPKKVLILGSGFAGTYVLRKLVPSLNRNENVEITMVSEDNYFLFSPLLHEVAMGVIETRHIAYSIRRIHWRDRFNFVRSCVNKIDIDNHKVYTNNGELEFDYLVLGLGSVSKTPEFKQSIGHKNLLPLKNLVDSMKMRNHLIRIFEEASAENDPDRIKQLLTFVVSGAGYSGVEVVTELRDFIYKHLVRFYKTIDASKIKIILVEREASIISEMDHKLGDYALSYLLKMGIQVRLESQVTGYEANQIEINGKVEFPAETLIWVTGVVANPRISEINAPKDNLGRLEVNLYLELPGHAGVYAVGDAAYFCDRKTGTVDPPRAHFAVRQAKIAAHNILSDIRGRGKKAYHVTVSTEIVSLGGSSAVMRLGRFRISGFPARLAWLVGYTFLVTGSYNRIRIVIDWFLSLIFGRDTTLLNIEEFNE